MAVAVENLPLSGLARYLVADGMLLLTQIEGAQAEAYRKDIPFISHLVRERLVEPQMLARRLAEKFGAALADLDAMAIDVECANLVGERIIRAHRVLPFFHRGNRLYVAVSDPTRPQGLDEIRFTTGFVVEPIVCEEDKLERQLSATLEALDTSFAGLDEVVELDEIRGRELEITAENLNDTTIESAEIGKDDAPIVRFVHQLMLLAIQRGASDIHFEPYEQFFRVRMRVDGILREIAKPPAALSPRFAARLKVIAGLDIAERRLPQDGRIKLRYSRNQAMDFRVSSIPTAWGEKVVLRLLDPANAGHGVDALGFEAFQRDLFMEALQRPQGMILVTGPTGSGKTLTLYTAVQLLNKEGINICTAEDPIEIRLAGINQLQVHPRIDLTFANALRAFLRQDPDVILVGEIRDLETAEIAVKAAQTGHLVLSTVHTNNAPKTLTRLRDIGVPPYSIASSVRLIIAQRLLRVLCAHCRTPLEIPREALLAEGFDDGDVAAGLRIYGAVGCAQCTGGYRGRTGVFEMMPVTDEMSYAVMKGEGDADIAKLAREAGVWNLRRSGLAKVKAGITTLDELHRVTVE
ncbi:MAG TPA: type IV-A pilus assembly ATPase PilB [Gammaproteobacteria bacterium]|nr:type IV-A pilus assembly ATPase PilB [Gammaproteobacteria bacterium]